MKKNIFFLLVLLLPFLAKAQFVVEGVINKGVFNDATVFFEKNKSSDSASPSGMKASIYIVYKDGKREEILSDFFPYVEQFNYRNDTLSFIGTVMTGDRYYILMTKTKQKWEVINSGFVANYDNLPQVSYNVKSLAIVDLYYTVIEYNPKLNFPVDLFYFNPINSQIDMYIQIGNSKIGSKDTILNLNGNFYQLVKSNYMLPKYR